MYITFPFYKKIEITEFSGHKLKALFKCHKLLDNSSFRIKIQYNSDVLTNSLNAILKDPDEFVEYQIEDDGVKKDFDFVKIYVAHNDKLIQTYQREKTRQQNDLLKINMGVPVELPTELRIKRKPVKTIDTTKLVGNLITAIHDLNVLSKNKLGCRIFQADVKIIDNLRKNVRNEKDFIFILLSIATFLDSVYTDEILQAGKIPKEPSLKPIESLFQVKRVKYSKKRITKPT
ncbi:MAG: hypothetical protein WAM14_16575 [Candidatus Nitrosopolaris sp.]